MGTGGSCTPTTVATATNKSIKVGAVDEYQWLAKLTLPATGSYCYRVYLGGIDLLGSNAAPIFTTQVPVGSTESFSFDVFGDWGSFNNTAGTPTRRTHGPDRRERARFAITVGDNGYPNGSQINYGDLSRPVPTRAPYSVQAVDRARKLDPAVHRGGQSRSQRGRAY